MRSSTDPEHLVVRTEAIRAEANGSTFLEVNKTTSRRSSVRSPPPTDWQSTT
jgi:hypothetical protein